MGCGMSTEEKEGKARNEEIENQLKRDKMMQRNEIKMLLLGKQPKHFLPPFEQIPTPRHSSAHQQFEKLDGVTRGTCR